MVEEEKVKAVCEYLVDEFKDGAVAESYDPGRQAHAFKIQTAKSSHEAVVAKEFFDLHPSASIPGVLKRFLLAEHLRDCAQPIRVTAHGLEMD